ncbi:hypothetical protein DPMN_117947 [Dreissena polymorpha]|uniref:Uncharacterized protein n=1 Tax=Dreissena polymorpha TaxID=45954 RepID=A0A9D4GJ58_DREPO|nr:hypothetical protein DPMN_117947 [Dreissena polymorpha]
MVSELYRKSFRYPPPEPPVPLAEFPPPLPASVGNRVLSYTTPPATVELGEPPVAP